MMDPRTGWRRDRRAVQRTVWCVILAALLVAPLGAAHATVTDLIDRLSGLASQLPRAPGARSHDGERRLVLNGQPLRLATGRAPGGVRGILDFYRQRFDAQARSPRAGLRMLGVQAGDDQAGYVVMIDPESAQALTEVARGERPFLSAGPLRMAYAQQRGDGTDYLIVRTDGPLGAEALRVPKGQDGAGQDIPNTPRPLGALRGLNLFEPATGYGLVSYRLDAVSPESALEVARDVLTAARYVEDPVSHAAATHADSALLQFHRDREGLLVRAHSRSAGGVEVTYLWTLR